MRAGEGGGKKGKGIIRTYHPSTYPSPSLTYQHVDRSAHSSWNSLSSLAELVEPKASNRAEFLEEIRSGQLDGVLVVYRTFPSVDKTGRFDAEVVSLVPDSLKFVCHNGTLSWGKDKIHSFFSGLFHRRNPNPFRYCIA